MQYDYSCIAFTIRERQDVGHTQGGRRVAGIDEGQARASVGLHRTADKGFATKQDIESLRAATKSDLPSLELRLIKWYVGGQAATIALVVALIRLL